MSRRKIAIDPATYQFQIGDHVCVLYTPTYELPFWFYHHGIFAGYKDKEPYFINLSRRGLSKDDIKVFGEGNKRWRIIEHDYKKFTREEVLIRAEDYLLNGGDEIRKYDILSNNCEHFVNLVIEGKKESSQVRHTLKATAVGLATVSVVGLSLINTIKNRNRPL